MNPPYRYLFHSNGGERGVFFRVALRYLSYDQVTFFLEKHFSPEPRTTNDEAPTVKQPAFDEAPTVKQPASDEAPTVKQPASDEAPTVKQPASDEAPRVEQPASDEAPTTSENFLVPSIEVDTIPSEEGEC